MTGLEVIAIFVAVRAYLSLFLGISCWLWPALFCLVQRKLPWGRSGLWSGVSVPVPVWGESLDSMLKR